MTALVLARARTGDRVALGRAAPVLPPAPLRVAVPCPA
jgi:hypothetical protein